MNTVIPFIPKPYFVKNLKDNTLGTLKIAILRKVIGNIIIRSSEQDETISFLLPGKEVVEIPARKLKSREKLTGLKLCRAHEVVDEEVRYNLLQHTRQLANPNSILFGDSVIEDALGLQSRVIYDWAYSLQDIADITTSLQHNALSESGTMWDENKAKLRKSLFQIRYVKAGAIFPHFVSVENVTPELFFHLLACLHFTNRYGAQHTTSGPNVENKIV
ncbi:MAG: type I-D CRISPR-associated protein Cas7/Csc2, partial [Bacteroidota bacterium]